MDVKTTYFLCLLRQLIADIIGSSSETTTIGLILSFKEKHKWFRKKIEKCQ